MDLKPIANKFTSSDGALTLWMLPFTSIRSTVRISELNALEPQYIWRHRDSGEELTVAPAEWLDAVKEAEDLDIEPQTPWERVYMWREEHSCFAVCEPAIIDVEIAPDAPADVRALGLYWVNRAGSARADWPLFNQLMSPNTIGLLFAAYADTRDQTMALPAEESADPQPVSGGRHGSSRTNGSLKTSQGPSARPKRKSTSRS